MKILNQSPLNYLAMVTVLVSTSLLKPEWFTWIFPYIDYLLASLMFFIGLSLTKNEFQEIIKQPRAIILCLLTQYVSMPLIAFILIYYLKPIPEISIGLLLVACCPGGTTSNIITYLAKGNVSLSVCTTTLSTLLMPIMTPLLLRLLTGQWIPISKFVVTISLIIIPISIGAWLTMNIKIISANIKNYTPIISIIIAIILVCTITSLNAKNILVYGVGILYLVILHNLIGLLVGYAIAQLFNLSRYDSKAIAIETGIQNSNLTSLIALQFLSPLTALPSALFSIWYNISGSLIANYWSKQRTPIIIISRKITPKHFNGITLYPFIFCSDEKQLCDSLINHESIHIAQQRELLLIGFYLIYVLHYFINLVIFQDKQKAYTNIVFEKEAYANENNLNYLENRKLWAFLAYFKYQKY